jgi:hypothetical protein
LIAVDTIKLYKTIVNIAEEYRIYVFFNSKQLDSKFPDLWTVYQDVELHYVSLCTHPF